MFLNFSVIKLRYYVCLIFFVLFNYHHYFINTSSTVLNLDPMPLPVLKTLVLNQVFLFCINCDYLLFVGYIIDGVKCEGGGEEGIGSV